MAWLAANRDELEAERRRKHAVWMAEAKRKREENRATIAENRRNSEQRQIRVTAESSTS